VSDIDGNLTADQLRASQAEAARWRRDFEAASDNVHVLVSSYVRQMDVRNRLQSALEECSRLATEPSDDKDMQLAGITRECQRALQDLSPHELALIVHTHAGAVRICRRCAESVCVPYGQGREAANG
jgi:hypothetical protein